jgi:hypothetical protein
MPDVEDMAKELVGNWKKFECFYWRRSKDLEDPDNWCIVYTRNRDSGMLEQSNHAFIECEMVPFMEGMTDEEEKDPDVVAERHDHWGPGWLEGYSIRVYKDGNITDAFKMWYEIQCSRADCPVLCDDDYSRREMEAAEDHISLIISPHTKPSVHPEDQVHEVWEWLWNNYPGTTIRWL